MWPLAAYPPQPARRESARFHAVATGGAQGYTSPVFPAFPPPVTGTLGSKFRLVTANPAHQFRGEVSVAKKKKTTQKKIATGSSGPAKAAKSKKTTRKKASASGGERVTAKSTKLTKSSKKKASTPKTAKKSTKKATAKKTSKTSKTSKKKSPAKASTGQKKAGKSKTTPKNTAKKAPVKRNEGKTVAAASNGHAPGLGQASTNGHQPLTDAQMRKVKTGLTKKDLKYFQQLLLEKRAEIVGDVAAMDLSRNGGGELSHMPLHMADIGSDNYEQEFTLGLVESEQKLLREIDEALVRIASGTYGVCVISGVPIGKPRLEVQPWAKYCIEVARQRERRM